MKTINQTTSYYAGVYLRISKEDVDLSLSEDKLQSNSIQNQKALIVDYLKQMSDVTVYDTYIDDGFSGTNFQNRPDFMRMIDDIYHEKVNMVIVKDLSRFGRDYIEADRYIQRIFPALSVRFVSVADRFDSLNANGSDLNLLIPVKNFINDNYARDTAIKIRSSQAAMRNAGLYVGAFVVYGYVKSPDNHNTIIIDEFAAAIVKKIFQMKLDGKNSIAIADRLNELGILAPSEYKKNIGVNYKTGFQIKSKVKWSALAVTRILSNKIYIGILEQGKRSTVSYKVKKTIYKPESEWSIIENNHEGIISKTDFKLVQKLLKADIRIAPNQESVYLFSGLLYCSDCKKGMVRRVNTYKGERKEYYICSTYNKTKLCTRHSIRLEELEDIVLEAINKQIDLMCKVKKILIYIEQNNLQKEDVTIYEEEIKERYKDLEKYTQLTSKLYKDLSEYIITESEFTKFKQAYAQKCQEIENNIAELKHAFDKLMEQKIVIHQWINHFIQNKNMNDLNRTLLLELVELIEIHERTDTCFKGVTIRFRFEDEFMALLNTSKYLPIQEPVLKEVL